MNYKGAPSKEVLSAIIYGDKGTIKNISDYLLVRLEAHSKICRMSEKELEVRRSQGASFELEFLLDILTNANELKKQEEEKMNFNSIVEEYKGLI